jgi:pSer/pThr/pTyr-binding forkhead associated (FHA) protein
VDSLDIYQQLAKPADPGGFIAQCPQMFLLKRPGRSAASGFGKPAQISFHTSHATQMIDPYPEEYRVSPIQKNPKNPFPDRMTVGRAPNCDVVVRMPSVSKVHAHLAYTGAGTLRLRHAKSSNTTLHNGRLVDGDDEVEVKPGDTISLGALALEVITSKDLYGILRQEAR